MTSIETVESSPNKQVESVSQDTLNLPSQQYGKANETLDAKLGVRNIQITLQDYTGDYSDGDVTLNVDTTLTRDMYYDTLTVPVGYALTTTGYRVYAKNIINNGTIRANGNNGSNGGNGGNGTINFVFGVGGTGGAGGTATASGTIFGTTAGATAPEGTGRPTEQKSGGRGTISADTSTTGPVAGVAGAASSAVSNSLCSSNGAAGGTGGYRSSGPGEAGGGGGTLTAYKGNITNPFLATHLIGFDGTNIALLKTGVGGGSGAGGMGGVGGALAANNAGGGGGGGGGGGASGGICYIWAKTIVNNGTIEAKGGNGGNGGNAGNPGEAQEGCGGGGGGGGGGGVVLLACGNYVGNGTISVDGGTGGNPGTGASSDGLAGSNGSSGTIIRITL